jgi:hypothetical protein
MQGPRHIGSLVSIDARDEDPEFLQPIMLLCGPPPATNNFWCVPGSNGMSQEAMDPIPTHEAQLKSFRLNAACVEGVSPTQTAGKLGIIDKP